MTALRQPSHTFSPLARHHVNPQFHVYPEAESLEPEWPRGELRLAAEVILAHALGEPVPKAVYERVFLTLAGLAK